MLFRRMNKNGERAFLKNDVHYFILFWMVLTVQLGVESYLIYIDASNPNRYDTIDRRTHGWFLSIMMLIITAISTLLFVALLYLMFRFQRYEFRRSKKHLLLHFLAFYLQAITRIVQGFENAEGGRCNVGIIAVRVIRALCIPEILFALSIIIFKRQ